MPQALFRVTILTRIGVSMDRPSEPANIRRREMMRGAPKRNLECRNLDMSGYQNRQFFPRSSPISHAVLKSNHVQICSDDTSLIRFPSRYLVDANRGNNTTLIIIEPVFGLHHH